jgi:uncharacterized protein
MAPQPVAAKDRIASIDVLRGVAVLGILVMNIQDFSMIGAAYWNPTTYGDLHGLNYAIWLASYVLADLKFMAIFAMLFGAGIVLMSAHVEAAGRRPAGLHYRRMGWLILFGLLHAHLLWSGDILFSYGMCGLLVYPLRKLRPAVLTCVGLLLMAVAPALMVAVAHLPPAALQGLREGMWQPPAADVAKELATYRGSWRGQLSDRIGDSLAVETLFFCFWTVWRVGGAMLIGMALFKLGVFSAKCRPQVYWSMIAVAVLGGIPAILYEVHRNFVVHWDFVRAFLYGSQWNYWASLAVALGWVGGAMLAAHTPAAQRFAAVGRMAFTNYIMQTVICTTIFYGHGLGLFGKVERTGQFAIVIAVWALELAWSPIWLARFRFGPLEWLWRSLTYWKREPMRLISNSSSSSAPAKK